MQVDIRERGESLEAERVQKRGERRKRRKKETEGPKKVLMGLHGGPLGPNRDSDGPRGAPSESSVAVRGSLWDPEGAALGPLCHPPLAWGPRGHGALWGDDSPPPPSFTPPSAAHEESSV